MPNYRRHFERGGMYFFTVVTEGRAPILCDPKARPLLRSAFRECLDRWPFQVIAIVLLPDHLHTIWSMPRGDDRYSARWGWIKKEFAKSWIAEGGDEQPLSKSRLRHRRHGVWQRRFWDHALRDENDLEHHCDYIHYNPVRHGLVECPSDWPYSSFRRFMREGTYPHDWGCGQHRSPFFDFDDLDATAME